MAGAKRLTAIRETLKPGRIRVTLASLAGLLAV
jgi:hypothetical protein